MIQYNVEFSALKMPRQTEYCIYTPFVRFQASVLATSQEQAVLAACNYAKELGLDIKHFTDCKVTMP